MRLVTRGDLDGVTSAVLLTTMEDIDSIELIHPQDITDDRFEIREDDIMANLPYHPRAALWFDHHELTESNRRPPETYRGRHELAPSVARVIYNYYNSEKLRKYEPLISETDRFDSARLEMHEVTDPKGIALLGFTIDSRSGIGEFREYFNQLVAWLRTMPVSEVLQQHEVKRRAALLREQNEVFAKVLKEHSRQEDNVVITDFRDLDKVPVGNRFLIYTLFPETNVSVRLQWGPDREFVAVTLGHNIFNRTSRANCGHICSHYGGGGHKGAGACPLKPEEVDEVVEEIVRFLKEVG